MTAIVIPAHNEAERIGAVLTAATAVATEVVVVADACSDDTANVASAYGARVLSIGVGDKGSAMAAGAAVVADPLVLFLDADLQGLTASHVSALSTYPPLDGMVVGLRDEAQPSGLPPISGERRLPTDFVRGLKLAGTGYRAELLIDAAVARAGLPHRHYRMVGVSNPTRPHLLMWADLAVTALFNLPSLALYTEQSVTSRR